MVQEILQEHIIPRPHYNTLLKQYLGTNIIKVVTGMRRVGKSSVMRYFIGDIIRDGYTTITNIFYINKEDLRFDNIRDYTDLDRFFTDFLGTIDTNQKICICIDEIQEIKGWERFINSIFSVYQTRIEIYITGSNSNMLSGELSTLIAGRYVELEIFPLSFDEYALFAKKDKTKELFLEYCKYGGLPGIFFMHHEDSIIFHYLRSIYSTIVLKDIISYFGVRNIDFLESLYKYIFANIGNIFSAKNISDYLKSQLIRISTETVLTYLDYGGRIYLLQMVKAVNPDTKKYFEIYNKYYVGDLGLRNSLVGFDLPKDIGKILENYVFIELKRHGYEMHIGRLPSGKEIDFIATKQGITKYFQVCYLLGSEDTIHREYAPLTEIRDNWEKYVVSLDDINLGISDGIRHIHVMHLDTVL